jgi:hypothetical protein
MEIIRLQVVQMKLSGFSIRQKCVHHLFLRTSNNKQIFMILLSSLSGLFLSKVIIEMRTAKVFCPNKNAVLKITVINFMHQDTVSCQRHLLDYYYVHPVAALVCNLSKSICIMYLYEDTVFLRIYIYARSYYR